MLSESIAERLSYKFYASADIATAEATPASDPGAASAQQLRHTPGLSLTLAKDYYRPNEKRADRTTAMGRHGMKRAPASIPGLLSPNTYSDLFEASLQGTWGAGLSLSESDFTSVTADNTTSKFTFSGGNPVTRGLLIGDIFQFASLLDTDNNGKFFLITGFGGSSNREVSVYPAPDTMTADSAFTLVSEPSLYRPIASHVRRKIAVERYNSDSDLAELYTEGRVGGFDLSVPPNDNASVTFNALFRNRVKYTAGSAPFFTSPTSPTTTGILSGVNGFLMVNGVSQGIVTGLTVSAAMQLALPAVIGSEGLGPDILLGEMDVSGNFSALLNAHTLSDLFDDETETSLLLWLKATSAVDTPGMSIYLPRIKLNSAGRSDGPELAQVESFDFTAASYEGSAVGVPLTVCRICDTEVTA